MELGGEMRGVRRELEGRVSLWRASGPSRERGWRTCGKEPLTGAAPVGAFVGADRAGGGGVSEGEAVGWEWSCARE